MVRLGCVLGIGLDQASDRLRCHEAEVGVSGMVENGLLCGGVACFFGLELDSLGYPRIDFFHSHRLTFLRWFSIAGSL